MPFLDSMDIANKALQYCGQYPIQSPTEDSKANRETSNAYDKVRRSELRRNTWRFAVKNTVLRAIDTDTRLLVPALYDQSTLYLPGEVARDINNFYWISLEAENLNNAPEDTDSWDAYFGPKTVSLYNSETSYYAGELVYKQGADAGSYQVWMSLETGNSDDPATATAWVIDTNYGLDAVVTFNGSMWRSTGPYNLGVTPADGPLAFDVTATYTTGQTTTGSDNFIYSSVGAGNIGHDPVTDAGVHWTNTHSANVWSRTPALITTSGKWRPITCTLKNLFLVYPIGSGPSNNSSNRNAFRLPAGYLRDAPQDPKAGSTSILGAPTGLAYTDWRFDGDYIISSESGPIVFRFVADVTKVSDMDDMFCEGLACRIATSVCEVLTQSAAKLQNIASAYKVFMTDARTVNAIEQGPVEPPEDDYLQCRI